MPWWITLTVCNFTYFPTFLNDSGVKCNYYLNSELHNQVIRIACCSLAERNIASAICCIILASFPSHISFPTPSSDIKDIKLSSSSFNAWWVGYVNLLLSLQINCDSPGRRVPTMIPLENVASNFLSFLPNLQLEVMRADLWPNPRRISAWSSYSEELLFANLIHPGAIFLWLALVCAHTNVGLSWNKYNARSISCTEMY